MKSFQINKTVFFFFSSFSSCIVIIFCWFCFQFHLPFWSTKSNWTFAPAHIIWQLRLHIFAVLPPFLYSYCWYNLLHFFLLTFLGLPLVVQIPCSFDISFVLLFKCIWNTVWHFFWITLWHCFGANFYLSGYLALMWVGTIWLDKCHSNLKHNKKDIFSLLYLLADPIKVRGCSKNTTTFIE